MPLIDKAYFTLEELQERWQLPKRDIVYLAENGLLRLSVRVFGVAIERSHFEAEPDGNWFEIPYERTRHVGLLDLLERDVFALFRDGRTLVSCFHHPGETIRLIEPTPSLEVRVSDVVVTREERDRVEAERGLELAAPAQSPCVASAPRPPVPPIAANAIVVSETCSEIRIGDLEFRLGRIQSRVVRLLREAAQAGDPWCDGKELLVAAGAKSARMADVFKSQPQWRHLILSNGRGRYRLAGDPRSPDT